MEEEEERSCKVIYFCVSAQGDDVDLLYDVHSLPDASVGVQDKDESLAAILDNARALLDQDRGGVVEGEKTRRRRPTYMQQTLSSYSSPNVY